MAQYHNVRLFIMKEVPHLDRYIDKMDLVVRRRFLANEMSNGELANLIMKLTKISPVSETYPLFCFLLAGREAGKIAKPRT